VLVIDVENEYAEEDVEGEGEGEGESEKGEFGELFSQGEDNIVSTPIKSNRTKKKKKKKKKRNEKEKVGGGLEDGQMREIENIKAELTVLNKMQMNGSEPRQRVSFSLPQITSPMGNS